MIDSFRHLILPWALALTAIHARAEDIDIFKAGGALDPSPPNVLVFLDNTSNWSANNQAWAKTDVLAKCGSDTICQNYVGQIFGNQTSLTQGQVELGALKLVLNELVCSSSLDEPMKLNVGLMMVVPDKGTYSNDAGTTTNSSGVTGYIRRAVNLLRNPTNLTDYTRCNTLLGDLDEISSRITTPTYKAASNANYGGAMFTAFKYFGGYTNPAGVTTGTAGSPPGHISFGPKRFGLPITLEENQAFVSGTSPAKSTFLSPIAGGTQNSCSAKNFILLVGNTWPDGDDMTILPRLSYTYTASLFPYASGGQERIPDVWAKFLSTTDVSPNSGQQATLTYVVNVFNASQDAKQTTLLKSMAKNGGGSYYEVNGSLGDLINAFRSFFMSINAQNSTFTPVSVVQSSASRSTYLNQMYLGLFRPDKNPRWFGNLKLYELGLNGSDEVILVDKAGTAAAATSGFIVDNAISHWTHSSSFWNFRCGSSQSTGDPVLCGNPLSVSDSPDGSVVEKGGASQILRDNFTANTSNSARKVYTCFGSGGSGTDCSAGALFAFDTTNITPSSTNHQTTFGAGSYSNPITGNNGPNGEVTDIVNWARGVDNVGENTLTTNQARPSIVGDVLHSQPVVVNYNSSATGCADKANLDKDVTVFYATNDGMLRAARGGTSGTGVGKELWSFLPQEFYITQKRLRDNNPPVIYTAPVPASKNNKAYTLDGSLSVYTQTTDCKPSKVWLYMTMRRGGRFIYALDVTDINNPEFKWKISNTSTGFGELGQTWSRVEPFLLANGTPALIFGAGYDAAVEDRAFDTGTGDYANPPSTTKSMGRGVFIVNADSGALIKAFGTSNGMADSVPSDVALVKNLLTGVARYAYVGDTGGYLWRISLLDSTGAPSSTSSDWTMTKIASLGNPSDTSKTGQYARKFFYPPDIVPTDSGYALMVGTGDREKPFEATVKNRFFRINDYVASNTTVKCESDAGPSCTCVTGNASTSCTVDNVTSNDTGNYTMSSNSRGWFIDLGAGQKVVGSAASDTGTTFFPTNIPGNTANQCALALGQAKMWSVKTENGGPEIIAGVTQSRYVDLPSGGFPPSPKLVTVAISTTDQNGNTTTTNRNAVVAPPGFVGTRPSIPTRRSIVYRYREGLD